MELEDRGRVYSLRATEVGTSSTTRARLDFMTTSLADNGSCALPLPSAVRFCEDVDPNESRGYLQLTIAAWTILGDSIRVWEKANLPFQTAITSQHTLLLLYTKFFNYCSMLSTRDQWKSACTRFKITKVYVSQLEENPHHSWPWGASKEIPRRVRPLESFRNFLNVALFVAFSYSNSSFSLWSTNDQSWWATRKEAIERNIKEVTECIKDAVQDVGRLRLNREPIRQREALPAAATVAAAAFQGQGLPRDPVVELDHVRRAGRHQARHQGLPESEDTTTACHDAIFNAQAFWYIQPSRCTLTFSIHQPLKQIYRQPGLLFTPRNFAQSSKFLGKKKKLFGTKVTSETFLSISQKLKVTSL